MEITTVSVQNHEITLYGLLMAAGALAAYLLCVLLPARGRVKKGQMALYGLLSAGLGLLLGRLIYCVVRVDFLFFDEMGEFLGLSPFFDLSLGSVNVCGVILGCLLAAPLAAKAMKGRAMRILDAAALPGLLLFACARIIEPLSGQGYGDFVENEALRFFPVMLENETYAICYLEALLALIVALVVLILQRKLHRSGTVFLTALTLLSASQILPESLRHDEGFLTILVFARVTQIGFAVFLGLALLLALLRGRKHRHFKVIAITEFALLLLGVGVCIAAEFALDKTTLPDSFIYLFMAAALGFMAALILRRIRKEDVVK